MKITLNQRVASKAQPAFGMKKWLQALVLGSTIPLAVVGCKAPTNTQKVNKGTTVTLELNQYAETGSEHYIVFKKGSAWYARGVKAGQERKLVPTYDNLADPEVIYWKGGRREKALYEYMDKHFRQGDRVVISGWRSTQGTPVIATPLGRYSGTNISFAEKVFRLRPFSNAKVVPYKGEASLEKDHDGFTWGRSIKDDEFVIFAVDDGRHGVDEAKTRQLYKRLSKMGKHARVQIDNAHRTLMNNPTPKGDKVQKVILVATPNSITQPEKEVYTAISSLRNPHHLSSNVYAMRTKSLHPFAKEAEWVELRFKPGSGALEQFNQIMKQIGPSQSGRLRITGKVNDNQYFDDSLSDYRTWGPVIEATSVSLVK